MSAVSAPPRVLVIDDDQLLNGSLQRKFRQLGLRAEGIGDGAEAVRRLKQQRFDAVLLDLKLPGRDGFEILRERGGTPNAKTPVFVITSMEEDQCRRAQEMGAQAAFDKLLRSPAEIATEVVRCLAAEGRGN